MLNTTSHDGLRPAAHAERAALADDLAKLGDAQRALPSQPTPMNQLAGTAAPAPQATDHSARFLVPTDRRRWLQLALASIWVLDGILQCQTFMFSKDFSASFLSGMAEGNPNWIASSILWAARIVETNPVLINAGFATLQLAIGVAIAFRPTLRIALAASIVWSLVVWWFGEGLGLLLAGGASALVGAPGAVLLYALLAVLAWPTIKDTSTSFVAAGPVGAPAAKLIWVILWGGLAALNLQPSQLTAGSVHSMVSGMGDGQPGWLRFLIDGFARISDHNGVALNIIGAVILGLIAVGIFLPQGWTRAVVISGVIVAAFIWVIGEALGTLFGGQGTDVNSGPLLALIALAYWPGGAAAATTTSTGVSE